MRKIHNDERRQRGCAFCADALVVQRRGGKRNERMCPHDECPYRELDEFETYGDYLKAKGPVSLSKLMNELGLGPL